MAAFVTPSDAREARLMNWFKKQDSFFSYREWPEWAQGLALMAHKNSSESYNLFYFLVGNGLDPKLAADFIGGSDATPTGSLIPGAYSAKERDELTRMMRLVYEGQFFTGEKRVFDIEKGRPVMM